MSGKRGSRAGKIRGIYLRSNTFWFARMEKGRRVQVSLGTSDYAEAVAKATALINNPFLEASEPLEQEIEAFFAHKTRQNEYSAASVEAKKYALKEFAKFVGKRVPGQITTPDVERFYRVLQDRVTGSTARSYITTIRSFFNRLRDLNKIHTNPVERVKLARVDTKVRELFCEPTLRDHLLANAPTDDLRFVLYCGFHAGMRKNEIIEARPEWFNLERRKIEIRATATFRVKDREARTIPLSPDFCGFLLRYGLRSPFVLRPDVKHGRARYRYDFRRPFDNFMRGQGCEWVSPHVMRHTFASLLACQGVSIFKIAEWMGDEVRVVQKHYAKLLPNDKDFEAAFPSIPEPAVSRAVIA